MFDLSLQAFLKMQSVNVNFKVKQGIGNPLVFNGQMHVSTFRLGIPQQLHKIGIALGFSQKMLIQRKYLQP